MDFFTKKCWVWFRVMIALLRGKIIELKPVSCVLDVNGVGYELFIPLTTYEKISGGCEVMLHVHTFHREDQLKLYGFFTEREKSLFVILMGVSGIGPSMALAILGRLPAQRLVEAVRNGNPALLLDVPGIGKAKAEKIVFELKRRIDRLEAVDEGPEFFTHSRSDAVEALVSLGFNEGQSARVVSEILSENPDVPLEIIIKESLKRLSA
jgi:Holliday junction DNA helicase RuvA